MAHKKGASSTRNGRDSNPQYLGVKRFGGQVVKSRRNHRASARNPLSPPVTTWGAVTMTPCLPSQQAK